MPDILPDIKDWINTRKMVNKDADKPCEDGLDYCPYGELVKAYPKVKDSKHACRVHGGHACPVFYQYQALEN